MAMNFGRRLYGGTTLAVDTNGNAYVTGYSTNFNTVKLSPEGAIYG